MEIKFIGHSLEITPAIQQYVKTKLEKIKRHFDRPVEVSVTASVEKNSQICSMHLRAMGKDFHVSKSSDKFYSAVDLVVDILDQHILKHKAKLNNVRK